MEFLPKVDRAASKSVAPDVPNGQPAKKGAQGAVADLFANELKSVSSQSRDDGRRANAPSDARVPKRDEVRSTSKEDVSPKNRNRVESKGVDRSAERPNSPAEVRVNNPQEAQSNGRPAESKPAVGSAEMTEPRVDGKASIKQRSMQEFMSEMESRFDVSPEEIVSAFAELDPETLNGPPEEAMNEFLAALQLTPQQMMDAAKLYQKMLRETGDQVLNEAMTGGEKALSMQVLGATDVKRQLLSDSLDQMSDRFFGRIGAEPAAAGGALNPSDLGMTAVAGEAPPEGLAEMLAKAQGEGVVATDAKQASAQPENSDDDSASSLGALMGALGTAAGATADAMSSADAPMARTSADGSSPLSASLESMMANAFSTESAGAEAGMTGGESGGGDSLGAFASGQEAQVALTAQTNGAEASSFAAVAARVEKSEDGRSRSEPGTEQMNLVAGTTAGVIGMKNGGEAAPTLRPEAMMANQFTPSLEEQQENVQELVRQSQLILRKGGGEMRMELKPEGIGSVNLKVLVQDGQVNVQMIAESDSAKKLLETGLNELKSQLAAHKLHVETLRVEMAQDGLRKFDQQTNSDAQREQARQFASDFLGQFRDERQGFRQGFMEGSGYGSYGRSQSRRGVEPAPIESAGGTVQAQKSQRADGSRRLNLVA